MSDVLSLLLNGETPSLERLACFIDAITQEEREALYAASSLLRRQQFGNRVIFRGLIEFTNYCRNNCLYCGIRSANAQALRYRLSAEQILACCDSGYRLGFRSFVLQGGEDAWFTDQRLTDIIACIHARFPDCALTLSFGEQSAASYRRYFDAGIHRYLLRHETADPTHYAKLHPKGMSLTHRAECLWELKRIGFQTGAGFMVGSPEQTALCLAQDLLFLKELQPHMVGIGPFIPHKETPFANHPMGSVQRTLDMLALTRILLPHALIPATTALGSATAQGREHALSIAANVIMPNLSPSNVRALYSLYDNKLSAGSEAAESMEKNKHDMRLAGFEPDLSRGDWVPPSQNITPHVLSRD